MNIEKLLIANRGEIACRIIRTARRLGVATVAVYSSADKRAQHTALADEAVWIGGAPASESYLNGSRVLEAAKTTGAQAIHPGYGFLAENANFARDCEASGILFVGPPATAIDAMGMKGVAREKMAASGVPVLPGINKITGDIGREAQAIGFPLLIKPEAGGGGKGMKIVRSPADLLDALDSARREANSAFGNDSLMLEKYLNGPRHIEIQVFADQHGNCVYLNERDCSLQRRHQKIIEESPAPGVSATLRKQMGEAAVAAAEAIGYVGAGTVEFLLGDNGDFYFMEMNTRLQVEHPVTEMVTGFDLVEWQLRVAGNEKLPASQKEIPLNGHAMEARLYAEDPLNAFLPVSGTVKELSLPLENTHLRIDNGIRAGDHVGVFYDPMLMKLIAHHNSRDECIDALRHALVETHVVGLRCNRDFLIRVLAHSPFRAGSIATSYLDQNQEKVFSAPTADESALYICAAALILTSSQGASPWDTAMNFRLNAHHENHLSLVHAGETVDIDMERQAAQTLVAFGERRHRCTITGAAGAASASNLHRITCDQQDLDVQSYRYEHRLILISSVRTFEFILPLEEAFHTEDEGNVRAPMSGRIVAFLVSAGVSVEKGTALAVVEAMKMEHTIRAPAKGTVVAIHFKEGDLIDEGTDLLEFEEALP